MWRDFPVTLAERTGCGALVYSRRGHGQSDRWDEPRSVRFMHDEALATLPRLLERLGVTAPIIVGHSDGGSIGLIYAGAQAGPLLGLILEAPHVFVEDLSVTSITAARTAFEDGDLRTRFQRHHGDNTDGVFRGWNDVWLSAEFRSWNIEDSLAGILVQTLVIQGRDMGMERSHRSRRLPLRLTGPSRRSCSTSASIHPIAIAEPTSSTQ